MPVHPPAGKGYQLGMQVLGIVVISAWACGLSGLAFWLLDKVGFPEGWAVST